jgi:NADH-quinone oxidoreductase subunit M
MELVPAVFPFIPLSIVLPLLGIVFIVFLEEKFAKWIALVFSGAVFVLSLVSLFYFDFSQAQKVQFYQSITLIEELNLNLSFGADGLSYLMYILTTSGFLCSHMLVYKRPSDKPPIEGILRLVFAL